MDRTEAHFTSRSAVQCPTACFSCLPKISLQNIVSREDIHKSPYPPCPPAFSLSFYFLTISPCEQRATRGGVACTHMTNTTPVTCRHSATSSLPIKTKTLQQNFLERAPKQGGGDVPVARLQGYSRAILFFLHPPEAPPSVPHPPPFLSIPIMPSCAGFFSDVCSCLSLRIDGIYSCEYD